MVAEPLADGKAREKAAARACKGLYRERTDTALRADSRGRDSRLRGNDVEQGNMGRRGAARPVRRRLPGMASATGPPGFYADSRRFRPLRAGRKNPAPQLRCITARAGGARSAAGSLRRNPTHREDAASASA